MAVEVCCNETRLGEVGRGLAVAEVEVREGLAGRGPAGRGMAVIVWRGVVRRGRLWRSNYNNSH